MDLQIKKKILSEKDLKLKIPSIRKKQKTIALSHGVFDLLHIGHIKHFNTIKEHCDCLIVSVTADKFVKKGPNRPYFNIEQRAYSIASLHNVDYVVISNYQTAEKMISIVRPDIYAKGPDYKDNKKDITKNIYKEIQCAKKYKSKILYTSDSKYSSSSIINTYFNKFNDDQNFFINQIKKKYTLNQILSIIENLSNSNLSLIGETIIDEYIFCDALGKSGKEPVLVVEEKNFIQYLGGIGHICNNISNFSNKTKVFTNLGNKKNEIDFFKKKFDRKARIFNIHKKNSTLNIKKRYIEYNNNIKLLGVYELDNHQFLKDEEQAFLNKISSYIKSKDTILITDYGHNLFSEKVINKINNLGNKKIINTQLNASNIGYHNMNKFKNVDLFFVNELEIRHEMKDRLSDLENLITQFSNKNNFKQIIVTCGQKGSIYYNSKSQKFIKCPAFGSKIIDKVGAGDTMLSMVAMLVHEEIEIDLSLFISSFAAIQSLESMGNSKSLNKVELIKTIDHVLA